MGGTGHFWVGNTEGKIIVRIDPQPIEPIEDIPIYGLPFAFAMESNEKLERLCKL